MTINLKLECHSNGRGSDESVSFSFIGAFNSWNYFVSVITERASIKYFMIILGRHHSISHLLLRAFFHLLLFLFFLVSRSFPFKMPIPSIGVQFPSTDRQLDTFFAVCARYIIYRQSFPLFSRIRISTKPKKRMNESEWNQTSKSETNHQTPLSCS